MIDANAYRTMTYELGGEHAGKWGMMIVLQHIRGGSIEEQPVTANREFDSEDAAKRYAAEFFAHHFS